MKTILGFIFVIFFTLCVYGQSYHFDIHEMDGATTTIAVSQIKNITFSQNQTPALQIIQSDGSQLEANITGIKNVSFDLKTTSVQPIPDKSVLNTYQYILHQNYPNPFNPVTTFSYSVLEDAVVALKIYDITGRELKTLVHKFHPAGEYRITFDGSQLPSGVYIYRLEASDFQKSHKFILMK
ncbi:T9SS type A sorting domain-containing protein [candidate division KSB1 bacterium]|nr:T9SS type A sorting domain-containing protein [candidate division KSB1 bacterium]